MGRRNKVAPKRLRSEAAADLSFQLADEGTVSNQNGDGYSCKELEGPPLKKNRVLRNTVHVAACTGFLLASFSHNYTSEYRISNVDSLSSRLSLTSTNNQPPTFNVALTPKDNSLTYKTILTSKNIIQSKSSENIELCHPADDVIIALAYCTASRSPMLSLAFTFEEEALRVEIRTNSNTFTRMDVIPQRETWQQKSMRIIIDWLFSNTLEPTYLFKNGFSTSKTEFNPQKFYQNLKRSGEEKMLPNPPPILNITLRRYQSRAVQWMIERETNESNSQIHPLFLPLHCKDFRFFYNPFTSTLCLKLPEIRSTVRGGILAEEMGLGKTIELLSCILIHPNSSILCEKEKYNNRLCIEKKKEMEEGSKRLLCYCELQSIEGTIQCLSCRTWQHQTCVGVSLEDEEGYVCPDCSFNAEEKVPSSTTLIICPAAIIQQWRHEIVKRTSLNTLKILIYEGISPSNRQNQLHSKMSTKRAILPKHLSQYDIVLTTYTILRNDLNHSFERRQSNGKRGNRRAKYRSLLTPLIGIRWWRICVDEAQMVSSGTAKATAMAIQLSGRHRWCISGTPIQRKGLEDLTGLLSFLSIPILSNPFTYKQAIQRPMELEEFQENALERLSSLIKPFFWRSSKEDVREELSIPPQSTKLHQLRLSPVESHFYKKQHEACSFATIHALVRDKENRLTGKQLSSLLNSLLKLRQACCHPQIGNHSPGIQIQRNPLSMEQLLDQLIMKAKVECEEVQRQWIVAGCGLAAIKLIEVIRDKNVESAIEAVTLYKEMIRVTNEHETYMDVDIIQKIHLYHNLAVVLGKIPMDSAGQLCEEVTTKMGQSLMDASLVERIGELRKKYSSSIQQDMLTVTFEYGLVTKSIDGMMESVVSMGEGGKDLPWWKVLFRSVPQELVDELKAILEASNTFNLYTRFSNQRGGSSQGILDRNLAARFYGPKQLQHFVDMEIQNIHHLRNEVQSLLETQKPSEDPNKLQEQVRLLLECSCKSYGFSRKEGVSCPCCRTFKEIQALEKVLFRDDLEGKNSTVGIGTKHDSKLSIILHALCRLLPKFLSQKDSTSYISHIKLEIKILNEIMKELKQMKLVWDSYRNYLLVLDEIAQASSRIRLAFPGEEISELEKNYKIQSYQIIPLTQQYSGMKKTSWLTLNQKKGQLKYLSTLHKNRTLHPKQLASSTEECIICTEEMGDHIVILACGHEFCGNCITAMIVASRGTLKCPTCRTRMNSDEIAFISDVPSETVSEKQEMSENMEEGDTMNGDDAISSLLSVQGSWGTKIDAVVRELQRILKEDPGTKSIVFSQWNEVLDIIAQALIQNNIPAVSMCHGNKKKLDANLHSFRFLAGISVLLLPLKKGANGLNLTEATHVFLVEPLLNPGTEEQAIGRVHRIGQTQRTVVHRFIVNNTVEDRIHALNEQRKQEQLLQCDESSWNTNQSEKDCMSSYLRELFEISEKMEEEQNKGDISHMKYPQPVVERFWNTLVHYNNSISTRHHVAQDMQTKYNLHLFNSNQASTPSSKLCNLYSVHLPHTIARRIMKLKEMDTNEDDNPSVSDTLRSE